MGLARLLRLLPILSLVLTSSTPAQPKASPKVSPQVLVASPLGVQAGTATQVTFRGLRIEGATEVRCHHPKVAVKLLAKGKVSGIQNEVVGGLGDETVTAELAVPRDAPPEAVVVTLITPDGETAPHRVVVDDGTIIAEVEPNNGFQTAHRIAVPATVAGSIQAAQDVDVFRFEGREGESIRCEVLASRLGSPLDASLTLYDAAGVALATADDSKDSRDPILTCRLPRTGAYFVALIDADDRGGQSHVYRLTVRHGN